MPAALSTKHSALAQRANGAGLEEMVSGGNTYYYLADGLGSTMAVVDAAGTVQKSYTYDVYGKPTATGSLANEFDFAGQQTDPTGLQYLRARYMDPATGIFLSRDPLSAAPSFLGHPFGYVDGNPANMVDPSGLFGCGWFSRICSGVGGIIDGIGDAPGWVRDQLKEIPGITKATAQWIKDVGWNAARADLNAPWTAWARALAELKGGDCHTRSDGIMLCFGLGDFFDSIGHGGHALTIGNVIMVREKTMEEWRQIRPGQLGHELRHADQWALSALPTGIVGQVGFAAENVAINKLLDECLNPYDWWAGLKAGGYDC